jgi:hypothetical protein
VHAQFPQHHDVSLDLPSAAFTGVGSVVATAVPWQRAWLDV